MPPIMFTINTYILWGLAAGLIIFRWKNQRDLWFALLGTSLAFPFEWYAINYPNLMVYDISYFMVFDRLPFWMIFAYGWFFGFPLIICLRFQEKIDKRPVWQRVVGLFVIFCIYDFAVEYAGTAVGHWVYYYPESWEIGGILPWTIPLFVSMHNTFLYFAHKYVLKFSEKTEWIPGFLMHILTYYIVIRGNMLTHAFIIFRIFGIDATIDLSTAP